jgi:hypothetical protein
MAACGNSGNPGNTGGGGSGGGGASTTSGSGTTTTSGTGTMAACPSGGTEKPDLVTCTTADTSMVTVPQGCAPAVDGVIHDVEWMDGACFNVSGAGGMTVVVKSSGDSLYMATSGAPTCGCGMQFYFLPAGGGGNFVVSVFDDPFGKDGDRSDFTLTSSGLTQATKDGSIDVECPGMMPTPVRYEWKIPLAKLGLEPGKAGQFKLAFTHSGAKWPAGLSVDGTSGLATFADGEPTWGVLSSTSW